MDNSTGTEKHTANTPSPKNQIAACNIKKDRDVMYSLKAYFCSTITIVCVLLFAYNTFITETNIIYNVLFFLPILLCGLWFDKMTGIGVAVLFSILIIVNNLLVGSQFPTEDYILVITFLLVSYVLGILQEKGQLAEKIIKHHAYHDSLTGLPNRLMFKEFLLS